MIEFPNIQYFIPGNGNAFYFLILTNEITTLHYDILSKKMASFL